MCMHSACIYTCMFTCDQCARARLYTTVQPRLPRSVLMLQRGCASLESCSVLLCATNSHSSINQLFDAVNWAPTAALIDNAIAIDNMKHKHREVSRRQPIQAPESESGLDEKQEEAKDESRQQKGPWEERKERQREMRWGGVKKG